MELSDEKKDKPRAKSGRKNEGREEDISPRVQKNALKPPLSPTSKRREKRNSQYQVPLLRSEFPEDNGQSVGDFKAHIEVMESAWSSFIQQVHFSHEMFVENQSSDIKQTEEYRKLKEELIRARWENEITSCELGQLRTRLQAKNDVIATLQRENHELQVKKLQFQLDLLKRRTSSVELDLSSL